MNNNASIWTIHSDSNLSSVHAQTSTPQASFSTVTRADMLSWIIPTNIPPKAVMYAGHILKEGEIFLHEDKIHDILCTDLSPLREFMTDGAWIKLIKEKQDGKVSNRLYRN